MEDFQIFIVFHKHIFDACYKNIPDEDLFKYFTFLAVNENIEKIYTKNKYKVIKEWELPIYDKTFQERGYNENSAIYHVYSNKLHKKYKYIGFFQYDMIFHDNITNLIYKHVNAPNIYFYFEIRDFNFCDWKEQNTLNFIIKDYETFFNKQFTKNREYPLYNSYIIPSETYEKIMKWVTQLYKKMYPWCVEKPNASHFCHIGGIYERIMAYGIGEENLNSFKLNVSHEHKYKKLSY